MVHAKSGESIRPNTKRSLMFAFFGVFCPGRSSSRPRGVLVLVSYLMGRAAKAPAKPKLTLERAPHRAKGRSSKAPIACTLLAGAAVCAVAAVCMSLWMDRRREPAIISLRANGYDDKVATLGDASWRDDLHALYPNATRISLWNSEGVEVAFSSRCTDNQTGCAEWARSGECERNQNFMRAECKRSCGRCTSGSSPALPIADDPLYAVLDHYPFVWPSTVGSRKRVRLSGGGSVMLHARSDSPRVFEAEGVASAAECAAIIRVAAPKLEESVTFTGGKKVVGGARTSATGWLNLPPASGSSPDEAMVRAVWLRLADLVRLDPRASENMQAISYARERGEPALCPWLRHASAAHRNACC